jgi:hypothetical protein
VSAIRVFFMEGGKVRRVPLTVFDRLHDGRERMPEHAGRIVRYALVSLETEDRKPVAVRYAEFGVLVFDRRGRLDPKVQREAMRMAVESVASVLEKRSEGSVIRAGGRFAQKRYADAFKWKPNPQELEAIQVALWGTVPR